MDYFSSSATTSDSSSFTNSTSATDVSPFAYFWSSISDATIWSWSEAFSYLLKKEVIDLAPTEKNMLDYPRGKLRMPKPVCPRGFKHLALRHEFSGPHFR